MSLQKILKKRKGLIITLLFLLIGFGARINYIVKYTVPPRDSFRYKTIISNRDRTENKAERLTILPFGLWILKTPNRLFKYDIIKGGILVNNVLGIFMIALAIHFSYYLFRKWSICILAGAIVATHPMFVRLSSTFLRENTYLTFQLLSLFFLYTFSQKKRVFDIIKVGICGGLAFLCKLEALEILPIAGIVFLYILAGKKIRGTKAIMCFIVLLLTIALSVFIICSVLDFEMVTFREVMTRFSNV